MFVNIILANSHWFSTELLQSLHIFDSQIGGILQFASVICHHLGGTTFFLALISLTYAFYRPKLALELSIGLLTAGIVIALAKFYFESPRPLPYPEQFDEKAFGLPSGHTYAAIVVWGLLIYRINNVWLRIVAAFVILYSPFSRMYLGVHFLGDVTLGFFMGTVHLAIVIFCIRNLDRKSIEHYFFKTKQYRTLSLMGMILTLSIILLDSPVLSSEHFHSLSSAMTSAGALAGFWMGLLFYPRFSKSHFLDWGFPYSKGKVDFAAIGFRFIVLLFILFIFYVLPGQFLKNTIWKEDLFLRYMRYFLVSFCLVFLYPIIVQMFAEGKFLLKEKDEAT
ncbi:MAG: phosphatase PAP2 family protein [Leptospira sp.]|nr:phosphatase PAP2 family protein [Leptospira sp.]